MKKTKLLMPLAGVTALGAVVPVIMTTTSCNKGISASEQDKKFLETVNSYLTYTDDLVAPHKAITMLKDCGIDVLGFQLSSSALEFAFDSSVKRFIIMNGDNVVACPDKYEMSSTTCVFKFVNTYDANSKYGQYLLDNFEWTSSKTFEATGSVDVGNNVNIKYMTFAPKANAMSKYLVRSYGETVAFDTGDNMVYHMGESNDIIVNGSGKDKCKFIEVGKTAYMKVSNTTLSVLKIDRVDTAQIDVLDAGENVAKGTTLDEDLVTIFTGEKIKDTSSEADPITATPVANLAALKTAVASNSYIKLTHDIEFDSSIATEADALIIQDVTTLIDLAGFNIIDNSTIPTKTETITSPVATTRQIGASVIQIIPSSDGNTTSATFINSKKTGTIQLNKSHNIYVNGVEGTYDSGKDAVLYLEGVNIVYNANDTTAKKSSAIKLGNRADTQHGASSGYQWSTLHMFGGSITAKTADSSYDAVGIFLNRDSYAQISYGEINSDTICARTDGDYLGSTIDIVNATLKMTSSGNDEAACIYLPRGKVNVTNATIEGRCCLAMAGGEANIAGGYLLATADHKDITATGVKTDGSVICMGVGSEWAYGTNPSLTVHNVSMQSKKSYIVQMFQTTTVSQYFELDFYGGNYYYGVDPTIAGENLYSGIRVQKDLVSQCRVNQYGGNWVKISA